MTTDAGPTETEVKFRVADRGAFEARLTALGARSGPREDERNTLFDTPDRALVAKRQVLRIREIDGAGLLTFKGKPVFDRGVKSRLELETNVDAPGRLRAILEALGYEAVFRYDKRRTPFRFADPARPLVVVDETPIGLFAEIEGEEAAVRLLAGELGVAEGELLGSSYVALYREARAQDPGLPADMVFPG